MPNKKNVRLRPTLYGGAGALKRLLPNLYGNFVKKLVFKRKKCRQFRPSDQELFFDLIVNKYEIKKIPKCAFLYGMFKILTVSWAPPQTTRGASDASQTT